MVKYVCLKAHLLSVSKTSESNSFCHLHNRTLWQGLIAALLIPMDPLGCANAFLTWGAFLIRQLKPKAELP